MLDISCSTILELQHVCLGPLQKCIALTCLTFLVVRFSNYKVLVWVNWKRLFHCFNMLGKSGMAVFELQHFYSSPFFRIAIACYTYLVIRFSNYNMSVWVHWKWNCFNMLNMSCNTILELQHVCLGPLKNIALTCYTYLERHSENNIPISNSRK